ncbi:short chain dehydrogenase [Paraburkholderia acidicola]|uniref:SDR family oxidoreductase n=1 Tax=Paraburkholderia acidicola TaxID=1912599 RepID=A0A2A4F6M6_9BURK|nr:SDR family oxidoreductase [Paraburkholderia acidicola]PCE28617.1 short chain dehydrogenase [Paraburkholderia acidicola]
MGARVFITGGASGLGRALAQRYARDGASVCIGDVDDIAGQQTLAALLAENVTAHYLHCDVTQEQQLQDAAAWLQAQWGGVDIVINNAGVAQIGGITESPIEDWQWAVDINLLGVVRGCKAFIPLLQAQGGGKLLNVASIAGLLFMPRSAGYNATKAAVIALSETLQLELHDSHIQVSVACPSYFRTDLARNMRASNAQIRHLTQHLVEKARLGPEEVAELIFTGVARGDTHILTHPVTRTAWRLKRWLPYSWYLGLVRKQMAKAAASTSAV